MSERSALVGGHRRRPGRRHGKWEVEPLQRPRRARVATVGARRPTTSTPTAAQWGSNQLVTCSTGSGVSTRPVTSTSSVAVGSLEGLVLLDLPDFDSRDVSNRAEAERVLALVDLFVWVTDPQKYADARCTMTMGGLGQPRRRDARGAQPGGSPHPHEVEECVADLKRLLVRDGCAGPPSSRSLHKRAPAWTRSASASPTRLPARLPRERGWRLMSAVRPSVWPVASPTVSPRSLRPTSTN